MVRATFPHAGSVSTDTQKFDRGGVVVAGNGTLAIGGSLELRPTVFQVVLIPGGGQRTTLAFSAGLDDPGHYPGQQHHPGQDSSHDQIAGFAEHHCESQHADRAEHWGDHLPDNAANRIWDDGGSGDYNKTGFDRRGSGPRRSVDFNRSCAAHQAVQRPANIREI